MLSFVSLPGDISPPNAPFIQNGSRNSNEKSTEKGEKGDRFIYPLKMKMKNKSVPLFTFL
jgi:hypothetical protein